MPLSWTLQDANESQYACMRHEHNQTIHEST